MSGNFSAALLLAVLLVGIGVVRCSPAIEVACGLKLQKWGRFSELRYKEIPCPNRKTSGFDPLEVCIENCAQCKKMLGDWFQGPLCAETCIKLRGKVIPECENFASISPFIVNKF